MKHDIAAIVVTYNRKDMLLECVRRVLDQRGVRCDVIVVDNASTDGTREALERRVSAGEVTYVNTGANLGGAGGFHHGIRYAVESGYKWLWLMDDDTLPDPDALAALTDADARLNGDYGFLSSKALWKDGAICAMNIQKRTKWRRMRAFERPERIQYASFVSLFLRASAVMAVGLPYRAFFIWADDWEYTRRLSKWRASYYIPASVVRHWCATNVGADIVAASPDRVGRFRYMYRNDVVLYRQDGLEGRLYLAIRNAVHRLRILLRAGDKRRKLAVIREATREGRAFYPEIEYPRARDGGETRDDESR